MSKLPVIFCVLFLACTSHGLTTLTSVLSSLTDAQKVVETTVEANIASIEVAANEGIEELKALAANVSASAQSIIDILQADIESIIVNTEAEVNALLADVTTVSTANKCSDIVETLSTTAASVIDEATTCVTKKVETAYGYITHFSSTVETLIAALLSISSETSNCVSNGKTLTETATALICVNEQLATATLISASSLTAITSDVAKLSILINNLQVDLPLCVLADTLNVLAKNANSVVKDVETCVANLL